MKHTKLAMAFLALAIGGCSAALAQQAEQQPAAPQARAPRAQPSPMASVMQRVGVDTDITVKFSRPGVKGRKIWGDVVPFGLAPANQYAKNPYPWRGGANAITTIEFSKPVKIDGNQLPEGKYGVHFIPSEKEWIMIFSKNATGHGSFAYNQEEDALRVKVVPVEAPFTEWLEYGFEHLSATGATGYLRWEKLKVPFAISID
jgi:hypothetical protein